jgi:hypothetical protein
VHNANVELLLQAVHWDVVVLQERSWRLSQDERTWRAGTWPYARTLNAEIRALGSRTAIYESGATARGSSPETASARCRSAPDEARFLRVIAHSTWLAHPIASPYSDWQRP